VGSVKMGTSAYGYFHLLLLLVDCCLLLARKLRLKNEQPATNNQ